MKTTVIKTVLWVVGCVSQGSGQIRYAVDTATYSFQSTIEQATLSENGRWLAYKKSWQRGEDTLFWREVSNRQKAGYIAGATDPKWYANWLTFRDTYGNLTRIDAQTGKSLIYGNVKEYGWCGAKQILWMVKVTDTLQIVDKTGRLLVEFANVLSVQPNNSGTSLAFVSSVGNSQNLQWLDLVGSNLIPKQIENANKFSALQWASDGTSIMALCEEEAWIAFNSITARKVTLKNERLSNNVRFQTTGKAIFFAPNGNSALIRLQRMLMPNKETVAQVWHAKDSTLFPIREKRKVEYLMILWDIEKNVVHEIGKPNDRLDLINWQSRTAIVSNDKNHRPSLLLHPLRDFQTVDLETGAVELLVSGEQNLPPPVFQASEGKAIYFRSDTKWYALIERDKKILPFQLPVGSSVQNLTPVATAQNGSALLVSDGYNIWQLFTDRPAVKRTNFNQDTHTLRVLEAKQQMEIPKELSHLPDADTQELILEIADKNRWGFAYGSLTTKRSYREIIKATGKPLSSIKSQNGKTAMVAFEEPQAPLKLLVIEPSKNTWSQIAKADPSPATVKMLPAIPVYHKGIDNTKLQSALYHPIDFAIGKKYPMVVNVYERPRIPVRYISPESNSAEGFNTMHFANAGYFVLDVEISYIKGQVGESAVKAIENAVEATLQKHPVDPSRIALLGHSFGGYEAFYTATRSSRFATVISGNGVSNLPQNFFTVSKNFKATQYFRFAANSQYNMGSNFFEDKAIYIENSPLFGADKVTVPTLSWVGGADDNVEPLQSMNFYSAMRLLSKEHVMLVYPGEQHVFLREQAKRDLNNKILEWLDHYLNGAPKQEWMLPK